MSLDKQPVYKAKVHSGEERTNLVNGDLFDAIKAEKIIRRSKDEVFRTRIWLSSWLLAIITKIMFVSKVKSERQMYRALFALGASLMENKHMKDADECFSIREELLFHDSISIREQAIPHVGVVTGVDSIENARGVMIDIPVWANESLSLMADKLNIQLSSTRRMAMYFAILTIIDKIDGIPEDLKTKMKDQLLKLEEIVKDRKHLFNYYKSCCVKEEEE